MRRGLPDTISELMQWCQIIENPERPPVRGRHQVVLFHYQVVDRHDRQVALQGLPGRTLVKGDVETRFRAGIEQTASRRILTDHTRKIVGRDA